MACMSPTETVKKFASVSSMCPSVRERKITNHKRQQQQKKRCWSTFAGQGEYEHAMEDLASYATVGLQDEAEEHLIKVLEERRARSSGAKDWDASVEGESPPLRRLSVEGINVLDPIQEEKKLSRPKQEHS